MGLFREYDLRGIVGKELTAEIAERVGRAYCTHVQRRGAKTVAVGRDGRLSSPDLHRALVKGLLAGGLNVVDMLKKNADVAEVREFLLFPGAVHSAARAVADHPYFGIFFIKLVFNRFHVIKYFIFCTEMIIRKIQSIIIFYIFI